MIDLQRRFDPSRSDRSHEDSQTFRYRRGRRHRRHRKRNARLAQQLYGLTEIPGAPGKFLDVRGLNNAGQIIGALYDNERPYLPTIAVIYNNGVMSRIDGMGFPLDINDRGQIVGFGTGANDDYESYLYSNGTLTTLPSPLHGQAINNRGQIAGVANGPQAGPDGRIYNSNGTVTEFGPDGQMLAPRAINESGQVVGNVSDGRREGFLYSNGTFKRLGTLGGFESYAYAINESGMIIGSSMTSEPDFLTHAFLYANDVMQDLGTLGGRYSAARDINDAGMVIGEADAAGGVRAAFLYRDGTMYNLNDLITGPLASYINLVYASDINNSGWIVATGIDRRDGSTHQFLLAPVPLPAAAWLLISGLAGLAGLRRRSV